MIDLEDLITPVTVDEAKETIYAVLAQLGCSTTGWASGGVVRAIVATVAIIVCAFSRMISALVRGGFRTLATGDWATLNAREVYKVDRILAQFAKGMLTVTKTGGNVYSLSPGDLIVKNNDNKTFRNTESVTFAAGDHTYSIAIEAAEAGSGSTSSSNTITSLVTGMSGVTVTNPTAIVGVDQESDAELASRCDGKLDAMSPNGPKSAYDYVARSCGQGVTKTKVYSTGGVVHVLVRNGTGALDSLSLAAVDQELQNKVVPVGITAVTESAVAKAIPISGVIKVWRTTNKSSQEILAAAIQALTTWLANKDIGGDGGHIYLDGITHIIASVDPAIYHVQLSAPAANVVIATNEAPVIGSTAALTVELS